jgi:uncharacterized glyoxalase superfamily protein PhnB
MSHLRAIEIKAFVPAQDFAMFKRLRAEPGFERRSKDGGVACLAEQPWGITEFEVADPAGVGWHIGQNTTGCAP